MGELQNATVDTEKTNERVLQLPQVQLPQPRNAYTPAQGHDTKGRGSAVPSREFESDEEFVKAIEVVVGALTPEQRTNAIAAENKERALTARTEQQLASLITVLTEEANHLSNPRSTVEVLRYNGFIFNQTERLKQARLLNNFL